MLGAAGHPHADAQAHPLALQRQLPLGHRPAQALGHHQGLLRGRGRQQQGELVPAEAGQEIGAAQLPRQDPGQLHDVAVARGMPQAVVHPLQPVGVHHQQAERLAVTGLAGALAAQGGEKGPEVGQPGQGVRLGQGLQAPAGCVQVLGQLGGEIDGQEKGGEGHEEPDPDLLPQGHAPLAEEEVKIDHSHQGQLHEGHPPAQGQGGGHQHHQVQPQEGAVGPPAVPDQPGHEGQHGPGLQSQMPGPRMTGPGPVAEDQSEGPVDGQAQAHGGSGLEGLRGPGSQVVPDPQYQQQPLQLRQAAPEALQLFLPQSSLCPPPASELSAARHPGLPRVLLWPASLSALSPRGAAACSGHCNVRPLAALKGPEGRARYYRLVGAGGLCLDGQHGHGRAPPARGRGLARLP